MATKQTPKPITADLGYDVGGDFFQTKKGAFAHAENLDLRPIRAALLNVSDPQALVDQAAEAIARNFGEYEADRYYEHAERTLLSLGLITKAQALRIKHKHIIVLYR